MTTNKDFSGYDKIIVLWTFQQSTINHETIYNYTKELQLNSCWDKVRLVLWGLPVRLLSEEKKLQKDIDELRKIGIEIQACTSDAHSYGVYTDLGRLGVEVVSTNDPINEYKKNNWAVVVF